MGRGRAGAGVAAALAACLVVVVVDAGCARSMFYAVRDGDTLADVAARNHMSARALAAANAIDDPDRALAPGELLFIPEHPLADGDTAPSPARPTRPSVALSSAPLAWPVAAPISSPFGARDGRLHAGLDLAVPDGTEVRAAAAGRVIYAGAKLRGYGNAIIVRHDGGLSTLYAHASALLVSVGDEVARGQVIARSGHSGNATAPHLHFEVRDHDAPEDPMRYLPDAGALASAPISRSP